MLKMVNTEFEVMVFDDQNRVFLVLKNPYNNADREVSWQLPKSSISGDTTIDEQAQRLMLDEYNIRISTTDLVIACDSMEELQYLISIGVVSYDNVLDDIEIENIKEDIAYNFYDMNELPKNMVDSSKRIINKYKEHNK